MERARIVEVARVFGWLGATAFGGPAAHVARMRSDLVDRRAWVDEATFLDLVGVTALLPGPNSTELAIELGRRRAGTAGLVAAGMAFITPAAGGRLPTERLVSPPRPPLLGKLSHNR